MKRTFVEDPDVRKVLDDNGVSDRQIRDMQYAIMHGAGKTMAGTGGVKKIRCGAAGRGKSGGVRVVFADYPATGKTFLLAALGKSDRENFTQAERNELRELKRALDRMVGS